LNRINSPAVSCSPVLLLKSAFVFEKRWVKEKPGGSGRNFGKYRHQLKHCGHRLYGLCPLVFIRADDSSRRLLIV